MTMGQVDRDFLIKGIKSNSTVLFLGAGFSAEALNRFNEPMPLRNGFAQKLWAFLNYSGAYDGTELPTMYDAALKRKHSDLQYLLNQSFQCSSIPAWYNLISNIYWYRIYSTNVDDLVETIYKMSAGPQKLMVLNGITDDYHDRDQFLEILQYIKLNGTLTDSPKSITFALSQYGDRLSDTEGWYEHFVRDYATRSTVFIGTELDEILLWRAIGSRGKRVPGGRLEKSFLICPKISQPKMDVLKDFNVVAVEATGKEFFEFLINEAKPLPSLQEVILNTNPGLEVMLKVRGAELNSARQKHIREFYSCFHPVTPKPHNPHYRSFFLFGCDPQWEDIYNDYDAPREFTKDVTEIILSALKQKQVQLLAITGSAGSGKSTLLKRLALQLSSGGHSVFFTTSEQLPALHHFEHALDLLPSESVLFFDNATLATSILPDYLAAAKRATLKHLFVIAGRASKMAERIPPLKAATKVVELPMPDLCSKDADSILDLLDRTHMLGQLANTPRAQQKEIFLSYAHNQILVAMRRATLGHGFDDIIQNEFLTTEPLEAKMLYLCASLATDAQFTISKQQLVGCNISPPATTLQLIQESLRGVLIPTSSSPDNFTARHRVIAELIVERFAPRAMLKEAYVKLLISVARDLPIGGVFNSAVARLYRRLINHATIYNRFSHHLAEARAIYMAVKTYFTRDHHFWLQFGSLELEYGELDSAANYIEQASKYAPDDAIVLTTRAHLRYKQSLNAKMIETAQELRNEAREILKGQIASSAQDTYPCHIFCTQELAWINLWLVMSKERNDALEELRSEANAMLKRHGGSSRLKNIVKQINDAYLDLAKPDSGATGGFNPVFK